MKNIVIVLLAINLLAFSAFSHSDELTEEKKSDIALLIKITGMADAMVQISDSVSTMIFENMKRNQPDIPVKVVDVLKEEVGGLYKESIPAFIELVQPIYSKYFTHSEIKDLIKFYQTSTGEKAIKVMPSLMQEGMVLGQQWARAMMPELQRRLNNRLKKDGYDIEV